MSWESRGEDGDGGEQTPGHGQALFELPLQDPQLQMNFSIKQKERKGKELLFCSSWLMLHGFNANELSHIHKRQKRGDGEMERSVRGKICCLLTCYTSGGIHWLWAGFCSLDKIKENITVGKQQE